MRILTAFLTLPILLLAVPAWSAQGVGRFDVLEFSVEGNSLLDAAVVENAVYSYLGESRSIEDVDQAAKALQEVYRKAGYPTVLVDIPEQEVVDGVVRLRVIEGTVSRLRVVGNRYYDAGRIRSALPSMADGEAPRFNAAQKELAALTRDERKLTPVLRPGPRFGTTEIDVNVKDRLPLAGSIEVNNYFGPNTEEIRLVGTVRYDNLWQRDHSASVTYQTTPQDTTQIRLFSTSYFAPVPSLNSYVGGYYARSRSNVFAGVGGLGLFGSGDIYGARWILNFDPRSGYRDSVSFGIDYKDFKDLIVAPGTPALATPIQWAPGSISYNGVLQSESAVTSVTTGPVFGIRGLTADDENFAQKRFRARSNFFVWKWSLQRSQQLGSGFSLFGQFDGQLTNDALISNEQFFAGGVATPAPVRGYLEAEALGDNGSHVSLEARTPPVSRWTGNAAHGVVLVAFADAASLSVNDPLPGQVVHTTLASTGLGFRYRSEGLVELVGDLGVPLRDSLFTKSGSTSFKISGKLRF